MPDSFRRQVISKLIEEIGLLTGGRFEQFGYAMMRVIHPGQWVERGTTVEGAPRGYTVDASAEGAALVAEFSSESDYFKGELLKPNRDLRHAIELHPDVRHIWLLSAREAAAGETTDCANLITAFSKEHASVAQVKILDARDIAVHIFDNLESERFVTGLSGYLPSLGRLADETAFSQRIPVYSSYLPRPDVERTVTGRLAAASFVVLKGISGIGKSALAARIATELSPSFALVIWHDARDLTDTTQLSDLDIRRTGTHHNIASLIRRHKCLLILDDAVLPLEQIAAMDCAQSKVLVTCQTSSDPQAITVGDLDPASARALLQTEVPAPCPDAVFQRVLGSIGGHPLLLKALNRLARDDGWDAVNTCCADAVSAIEDERHNKVCERILLKHRQALSAELEFVKWCGTARFDAELIGACVSNQAVRNLHKRAFLAATTSGHVRVHDVVYQSIRAVIEVSAERDSTFRDRLDQFIRSECEHDDFLIRRIAQIHAPLVHRLLAFDRRSSFVYAAALARSADTPLDLIGDPIPAAKALAARDEWTGREVELRAVIEGVEALYTLTSARHGADAARTSLQRDITALETLRGSSAAKGELLRDIKHHYAKMLERLGRLPEAETEFRAILADHSTFAAARLQLARILEKSKRHREALDECRQILAQQVAGEFPVSAAVSLEALRLLATLGSPEDLAPHEPLIMSTLARVREFDRGLAFRLIASVAQKTWFTMPQLVVRMFDAIEWRDSVPTSDFERFDWAQAHKLAGKVAKFDDPRHREFLVAADEMYKSIKAQTPYQIVQHAEALILLERFADAGSRLELVPEANRGPFWWQRKAQALLGTKRADAALDAINEALHHLKDQKYKAAFLRDRHQIRRTLGDPAAKEDLQAAIDSLPPDTKFRRQLEAELGNIP